jgi:hypothetical protein
MTILCAAAVAMTGCGPFGYLSKVAKEANRAVADAKAVGAEEYAPYEYWGAVSYLEQAKLMMTYSEYERSFDYGARAKQLAEEAKRKAELRESGKMTQSLEPEDKPESGGDRSSPPPADDPAGGGAPNKPGAAASSANGPKAQGEQ